MDDSNRNSLGNPQTSGEGPSIEKRMLLAFVLMGLVLFLTQYLYRPPAPRSKSQPSSAAVPAAPAVARETVSAPPVPAPQLPAGNVAAAAEQLYTVETDLYRVVFSNRGAVVRSWVLKKYRDQQGKPLDLVDAAGAEKTAWPFSVDAGAPGAPDWNQLLCVAQSSADGLSITFEYAAPEAALRKSFRFQRNRYLVDITSAVAIGGKPVPHLLTWRGGFGDHSIANHAAHLHALRFDLAQNKLIVEEAKAAKNGPVSHSGSFSFAGIEDKYFAAVALPEGPRGFELRTYSDRRAPAENASEVAYLGAGIGGAAENRFSMFVGPKDIAVLRSVNPKLEQVVDFGWFSFIAKPLFLAINWINNRWIHNYGWSIVLVTVIINFLLLPLKYTSLRSMRKMQALQPQIQAINEKYKGISLRDPRKSEQQQEIMELYKKHGVNPMGGCMPMLLQLPFFFAFYKVLTVAIELRGAEWLWVKDLSEPEQIPIRILPIAMIVSQFVMQKMTPTTMSDPAQQRMMMLMPLVFGFMFYGLSSGLVLYWLTGNLVGIAQQWFFNKIGGPAPAPAAPPQPVKSKKKTRK
ncbi:MAG: membrane protein insertase YidC [Bryobacteraceae bacterium]